MLQSPTQKRFLVCQLCGKQSAIGYNRPKSLHKTKRAIHPNVQSWQGLVICNRCRRTLKKFEAKPTHQQV